MAAPEGLVVGNVGVIAYGGTNARQVVNYETGELGEPTFAKTPRDRAGFVSWLAETTHGMIENDRVEDIFVGFPGPTKVRNGRTIVGPMVNVPFLKEDTMILEDVLADEDPELGELMRAGNVNVLAGNDGQLHAASIAELLGMVVAHQSEVADGESLPAEYHDVITGIIVGTGLGTDTVERVEGEFYSRTPGGLLKPIYRPRTGLREWGHWPVGEDPDDTYETRHSGPALDSNPEFDMSSLEASSKPDHPMWRFEGRGLANLIRMIALTDAPDLIGFCGGLGSREFENYAPHLRERIGELIASHNTNLRLVLQNAEVTAVDPNKADVSELYGVPVLMAAARLRAA